jgi:NAD(P)H-quinone oxidoreductase subunit M
MEKMLLKSTTRHVRIFTAEVVDEELKFHPNKLTLDLDPDNEFIWNEDSLNKINEKFNELIKERAGKDLDDYELRKIGSEIEGLIKFLLQNGQLSYNTDCRVMNYSMGLPKTNEVL